MAIQITIPITPVTKKNHQQIMRSSKTGKPFVMPSAEYRQPDHRIARREPRAIRQGQSPHGGEHNRL